MCGHPGNINANSHYISLEGLIITNGLFMIDPSGEQLPTCPDLTDVGGVSGLWLLKL